MKRNGTLAGAFALLFLGWIFLPRAIHHDYLWTSRNVGMWIFFGIAMAVLGSIDKLLAPKPMKAAGIGGFLGRRLFGKSFLAGTRFGQQSTVAGAGWFASLWGFLGVALGGLLFLGIQNGVAPEFFLDKDMSQLWPLILLYLGVGQLIGLCLDLVRRFAGLIV
jgi:hypothetical protein